MAKLEGSMEALCNATSAAIGGTVATFTTFPVDTVGKKQATTGGGMLEILQKILKEDGINGLFKGVDSKLGWSFGGKFIFYGSYSLLVSMWNSLSGNAPLTFIPDLALGYLSEFSTLPVALPFEAIATRLQTSKGESFISAITNILHSDGVAGLYKGLSAYWVLCLTPAITNTVFQQIKMFVLKEGKVTLSTLEGFCYGAVARAIATFIMYPVLRCKTLMQVSSKGGAPTSVGAIIKDTIDKEGIFGLYKGLPSELIRGVISSAVTMMLKERIYAVNKGFFLRLAGTSQAKKSIPMASA